MDCTKMLMVIPVTVVLMISASGCTSMPPPDAYHSEQSYVMYKHDMDPQRAIYSRIDLQVADRCVATFSRGDTENTKIEASWTGECKNGRADGLGVMRFREFKDQGENKHFRFEVDAGVVDGVLVAGECMRGVVTTVHEYPDNTFPTIDRATVRPCEGEPGRSPFTSAMGILLKRDQTVRGDSFSTLNPLALDFFRTTFPRHHIKGITYNPDDTRSSFKQILIGALRVFTAVGQLKVAEKRAKNAENPYDQYRSQGSKASNTYVDVFPMDKDEVLDVSNQQYAIMVTCGLKVQVTTYVWVIDDDTYYCGSSSDEAVSGCRAYANGVIEWKLNPDQFEYVDGWRQKSGFLQISLNLGADEKIAIAEAKDGTYTLLSLYTETVPLRNSPDIAVQRKKESSGSCKVYRNRNR